MRLGWCGSETLLDLLVRLDSGQDHVFFAALDTSTVLILGLRHEHPVHDATEDRFE